MTIYVTQEDIERSKQMLGNSIGFFLDKFYDPIAIAIRRSINVNRVIVHLHAFEVNGKFISLPPEAQDWCRNWCKGIVGLPFSFKIDYEPEHT